MLTTEQIYSMEIARILLADDRLTIRNVKEKVSAITGTPLRKILAKSEKKQRAPYMRSLIYFLYEQLGLDYGWIQRMTGRTDHSTIAKGIQQMRGFIDEYNETTSDPVNLLPRPAPYIHSVALVGRLMTESGVESHNIELRLSDATGVSPEEIRGRSREAPVVTVRQIRDYVLRARFGLEISDIVREKGRDYKSVEQGIEKIESYVMGAREHLAQRRRS